MREQDLLLSAGKRNKFQRMISRKIWEEFGETVDVLVQTDGRIFLREEDSVTEAPDVVINQRSEVYNVLSELEFAKGESSYELIDSDKEGENVGSEFYLKRDGW